MGVDEGRKGCNFLAKNMKACAVVGRGNKSLLGDPGSELHLGRAKQKEKCQDVRQLKGISQIYICPHVFKNSALPSPVIRLTGFT